MLLASEYKKAGEASNRTNDIVDCFDRLDGDRFPLFFCFSYIALRQKTLAIIFFSYSIGQPLTFQDGPQ